MRVLLIGLALLCLQACATRATDALYQDLGGTEGIRDLVSKAGEEIRADERINFLFAETDWADLERLLTEQICELAGGPCEYTGLPMEDAHFGQNVSITEFNIFVEDFERAMIRQGLPTPVQNRLLARLAPMRGEIIRQ